MKTSVALVSIFAATQSASAMSLVSLHGAPADFMTGGTSILVAIGCATLLAGALAFRLRKS